MEDNSLVCDTATIKDLVKKRDKQELSFFIDNITTSEKARILERISLKEREILLNIIDPEKAADLLEQIPEVMAIDILEDLNPGDAARIMDEIDSNDRADIVSGLEPETAVAILTEMNPEEAEDLKLLSAYPHHVAGGLMITEYLWHFEADNVSDIIDDLRSNSEIYSDFDIQYVYIVDSEKRLTGVLRLRDLLISPGNRKAIDIMIKDPFYINHMANLNILDEFFEKNKFIGAPVVDDHNRLLGVIREADVDEALIDKTDNDFLKTQGIVGGEELRSMPIFTRASRRLSWLSVNIFFNIIAASVIAAYQDTLAQVIALAVFLPIISDMSGCSGNQAVAVSLRELSLGLITPYEVFRVWLKELSVGLINGSSLGIMLGGAAFLWKGNIFLGMVIAIAMTLNTIIAVSIGGMIPLFLKMIKADPALASGPILTTITDMCGFMLVLGLATMLLPYLT